MMLDKFLRAEP